MISWTYTVILSILISIIGNILTPIVTKWWEQYSNRQRVKNERIRSKYQRQINFYLSHPEMRTYLLYNAITNAIFMLAFIMIGLIIGLGFSDELDNSTVDLSSALGINLELVSKLSAFLPLSIIFIIVVIKLMQKMQLITDVFLRIEREIRDKEGE